MKLIPRETKASGNMQICSSMLFFLHSKIRDTLLLAHTMSEEAIFKLMFDEDLPAQEAPVEID